MKPNTEQIEDITEGECLANMYRKIFDGLLNAKNIIELGKLMKQARADID